MLFTSVCRVAVATAFYGVVCSVSLPATPVTAHYVESGPLTDIPMSQAHCPPIKKGGAVGNYVAGYIAGDLAGHVTGCIYPSAASTTSATIFIANLRLTTSSQTLDVSVAGTSVLTSYGNDLAAAGTGTYAVQSNSTTGTLGGIGAFNVFTTASTVRFQMQGSFGQ